MRSSLNTEFSNSTPQRSFYLLREKIEKLEQRVFNEEQLNLKLVGELQEMRRKVLAIQKKWGAWEK